MKKQYRKLLWIGLFLSLVLGSIWQFPPLPDAKNRLNQLPISGKEFVGQNLPMEAWEKATFKDVNVLKRAYQIDNDQYFIYILDGTKNRHVVHDPAFCFRGAGWKFLASEIVAINHGTATFLKLGRGKESKEAMYWFSDGSSHYHSPIRYWWQTTLRRLTLGLSGPEPVLIVVQPRNTSSLNWKTLLKNFPQILKI